MAKKKKEEYFEIGFKWHGEKHNYMYLILGKNSVSIDCGNHNDFVKLLKEASIMNTKSVRVGKMSVDKLNQSDIQMLENHNVRVYPCYFCNKSTLPLFIINPKERYGEKVHLCKKHLQQLTEYLEDIEKEGTCKITSNHKLGVTTYEEIEEQK